MREMSSNIIHFFRSSSLLCHVILQSILISFQLYKTSSDCLSQMMCSQSGTKQRKNGFCRGLEAILAEEDEFDEAELFHEPVDHKKVLDHCEAVPFRTSISTIAEPLRNGCYR